jgi:hypothetical protein
MQTTKQSHKITDEQFRETFKECNGGYTKTAKAIERKYGISYTRQSAQERALNLPDVEKEALALREEYHENALADIADDESLDIKFRARLHRDAVNRLSKYRLLHIRIDAEKAQQKPAEPEGYFEIDGKEFRF